MKKLKAIVMCIEKVEVAMEQEIVQKFQERFRDLIIEFDAEELSREVKLICRVAMILDLLVGCDKEESNYIIDNVKDNSKVWQNSEILN